MKISKYHQFINESKEDIDLICQMYNIKDYIINKDGSVDVDGDVIITFAGLKKIPLKFRNISGHFSVNYNCLTSLEGCPKSVGGHFACHHNQLISLEGCPQRIGRSVDFQHNQIRDLKGFPEDFDGKYSIDYNPISEIYYFFEKNPKFIYWMQEYDVIQNDKIVYDRLEAVAYEMKMELPENLTFENYEIV